MSLAEAENLAFEILKQVMEEKINNINVEVASVTEKVIIFFALVTLLAVFYFFLSFSFLILLNFYMHIAVSLLLFCRATTCTRQMSWTRSSPDWHKISVVA